MLQLQLQAFHGSRADLRHSFLPVTIDFHEKANNTRPDPPSRVESNQNLSYELPNHASAPSLLKGHTPPRTPKAENAEDMFAQFGSESQGLHSAVTPGNTRLMRSDVHLPEWGQQGIFNQPKSRAKPLPSNSILDFSQTYDDLLRQRHKSPRSRAQSNAGSPLESPFKNRTWTVEPAVQGNGGLTNAAREAADQAELLADHGEQEVGVGLGQPVELLDAAAQAHAEDLAAADGDQRVR